MTASLNTLRDRVGAIDSAQTPQEAFDRLYDALNPYGFSAVFARRGELWVDETLLPTGIYFTKGMDAFVAQYQAQHYVYIDPVVAHLARTNRPFRWRESHKDLTPEQKAYVKETHEYGLKYGLAVPIVTSPGLSSLVFMGQEKDFELSRVEMIEIELLCCFAFEIIEARLGDAGNLAFKLTQKEHEVLDLVGKGKTNWEIGQIMSISEYSVRDYLKSLSKKFHTSNRTHTVVKAIQLGLIRP